MKVAIIGNENIVLPLKSIGMEIINIHNKEEGEEFFQKVRNPESDKDTYGIIFVTSDWYKKLESEIVKFKNRPLPAIISLPSPTEKEGATLSNLEKLIERAIGSKLILKT
jgi:vacuolar-type H+-ATPase subunit F/Vma7